MQSLQSLRLHQCSRESYQDILSRLHTGIRFTASRCRPWPRRGQNHFLSLTVQQPIPIRHRFNFITDKGYHRVVRHKTTAVHVPLHLFTQNCEQDVCLRILRQWCDTYFLELSLNCIVYSRKFCIEGIVFLKLIDRQYFKHGMKDSNKCGNLIL